MAGLLGVCVTSAAWGQELKLGVERLEAALDELVAPGTVVEKLAEGFNWSEGPVWLGDQVVFSDVPENTAFAWREGESAARVFLKPSGKLVGEGQGSNGLAVDAEGRLILCQHGERRVARMEADGTFTVLADRFEERRFNSPNDLVVARNGALFFTDPPYGLGRGVEPELPFHGVYRLDPGGKVTAVIRDVRWPNGIALSPDEKRLYLAVSDKEAPLVMVYDLTREGTVTGGRVLFDAKPLSAAGRAGSCDGLKVDERGNVWTTGPGGVLVLSPEGKHLGSILTGVPTGNCAWGGPERDTLYITADMALLRVKTRVRGR